MYILTNEEMKKADRYTIETLGVPSLDLMERAGTALADEAERLAPSGRIVCVCGGGNNGGDGFVCARILRGRGRETDVVFFAERISTDCQTNLERWKEAGGEILSDLPKTEYALAVDCLVGTGLKGGLQGKNAEEVEKLNAIKAKGTKILAADIPSGLNGDNGSRDGVAVNADVTLCIGELKAGALIADGLDLAGEVKRANIGIELPEKEGYAVLADRALAAALLPKRRRNSHKGSYGRAAIVAGSIEYTGAAYLSAAACLRAGAGYTTLFVPQGILPYYILKAPEILLKTTNEGDRYAFNTEKMKELLGYDSIAYGMGMGISEEVARGAAYLLRHFSGRLILDADGLNALAAFEKENFSALFENKKCDVLLTPHIKEFSRLSGEEVADIVKGGTSAAKSFAKKYRVSVVLKNSAVCITDGERVRVVTAGSSGQAKGGSGDVLSGVLAGLCAVTSAFDCGVLGAYLTQRAAELAAAKTGEYSLVATDIISYLGAAFLEITHTRKYE